MKSKISFFNKTIFWKNVTLYWPIWGAYTLILVFCQPFMLWISEYSAQDFATYDYGDHLYNLFSVLVMEGHILGIALVAILIGMALFHYLYNSKSANMIHSLPVDRTQLFCTNVISGIAFLAVPQLFSAVLTAIVAISFGISEVQYIAIWFLMTLGTDIVAFAFVTFCAMFTGHIVALPVYVCIVNYFVYWIYYLIETVVNVWGYGVDSIGTRYQGLLDIFCPLNTFLNYVDISMKYDMGYEFTGVDVSGIPVILGYLVVAVILYVVAYCVYRKRHIEQAGEILTVSWVKPIFRFGVGLTGGFFGGMLFREILQSIGISCGLAGFLLLMLIIGGIAYFIADMLVKKSFHVFKKKNWISCGIFSVLMLVAFFGLYGIANSMEDYIPKLSEIETASVDLGYTVELEGEEAATIIDIHEEILANKDFGEKFENNLQYYGYNYEYVTICYNLKNGNYVSRTYRLYNQYDGYQSVFDKIEVLEKDVDNYLNYTFCDDYEEISVFNGGSFEAQFKGGEDNQDDVSYQTIDLNSEQVEALYNAVIADAKAGTLMDYNVYDVWKAEDAQDIAHKYSDAYLYIEYLNPNQENGGTLVLDENSYSTSTMFGTVTEIVEYQSWYTAYLNFGPDCENIVNTLIELGIIESVDNIYWGDYEE